MRGSGSVGSSSAFGRTAPPKPGGGRFSTGTMNVLEELMKEAGLPKRTAQRLRSNAAGNEMLTLLKQRARRGLR